MKYRYSILFSVLFPWILHSCKPTNQNIPKAENGIIDLTKTELHLSKFIVPLDGEWEFYRNQFLDFNDFTSGVKEYKPEILNVPGYWNIKSQPSQGFGTYRLKIKVLPQDSLLFIKFKTISTSFKAFLDNNLLADAGKTGRSENGSRPEYKPQIIPLILNKNESTKHSEYQLIIQVSNFSHANSGLWETIYIGTFENIQYYRDDLIFIKLIIAGLILIMSLYHFGLFALRRNEKSYLYFALFSLFLVFRNLTTDEIPLLHWISGGFEIQRKIEYLTAYANSVFLFLFFNALFKDEIPKILLKIFVGIGILIGFIIIVFPLYTYSHLKLFFNLYVFIGGMYLVFGVLLRAFIRKRSGAGFALLGMSVLYFTGIYDVFRGAGIIQTMYLADFGLAFYIFVQSYALAKLFATAFNENAALTQKLDYQNKNLEKIVEQRTFEITKQKEELKKQSEGLIQNNIIISEKNEELKQQNEEILAQRDELESQRFLLNQQHERIQSSIKYAGTIQSAILPWKGSIDKVFESFIIFKPKDVVSGDFYWYSHIAKKDSCCEKYFFAVVDCTGHGVPGAFMSMIGNRLLNGIVNERKIYEPSAILAELSKDVSKSLKQKRSDNRDGMDVCLCKIERPENQTRVLVTFAGAKRPLYIFDTAQSKLLKYSGSRKTVGGVESKSHIAFESIEIKVEKDSVLYLTSDGYVDQNNAAREKFGSQKLEILLSEIGDKKPNIQKMMLESILEEHMKDATQRDDITIWGIKI